ncbi:transposase [Cupriavidus sp. KK10]|uniref:IS66-like element accessory protein TnpA n=1 Tax=Cupriavidus sp. KK10 TaxID=1478019 RepID=UPI002011BCB7|nr:transposase [Cupriavidus sp. KK10]
MAKQVGRIQGSRNHPIELKRRLAEAACVPGVSVSKLALEHGLNVNMVFRWRRMYRAGHFGPPEVAHDPLLLPVIVAPAVDASSDLPPAGNQCDQPGESPTGVIRLQLAKGQVTIEGRVDPEALRTVVQCLSQ